MFVFYNRKRKKSELQKEGKDMGVYNTVGNVRLLQSSGQQKEKEE